jgi:hypothetical protein
MFLGNCFLALLRDGVWRLELGIGLLCGGLEPNFFGMEIIKL